MTQPITPTEAQRKASRLPPEVFMAFNEAIQKHYCAGISGFTQEEVIEGIRDRLSVERHQIFINHWLDIEEDYRAAGWLVTYDKPGPGEFDAPTFLFTARHGKVP